MNYKISYKINRNLLTLNKVIFTKTCSYLWSVTVNLLLLFCRYRHVWQHVLLNCYNNVPFPNELIQFNWSFQISSYYLNKINSLGYFLFPWKEKNLCLLKCLWLMLVLSAFQGQKHLLLLFFITQGHWWWYFCHYPKVVLTKDH